MESAVKQASLRDTVKTVLFGFIGVRRRADHEKVEFKPQHVIAVAILGVVLFVLTLVTIVRIVTS
jgi:hypothetical protein